MEPLRCKAMRYVPAQLWTAWALQGRHAAAGATQGATPVAIVRQSFFQYAPSLKEQMQAAALVISHAGSGSIFEALSYGRPLIVVPNLLLMDNHQAELGTHLAELQHLVCSTPTGLVDAVKQLDVSKLKPYTSSKQESDAAAKRIVAEIDRVVGFA